MSSPLPATPATGRSASRFSTLAPLLAAIVLASAFALGLPAYSGPDENGHMAYVSALAQGHLPIIPNDQIADMATGTTWQGQHPPLFYLLATPLYLLVGKSPTLGLYALRLLGVACMAATVALVQRLAALLLDQRARAVGVAPGVASGVAAWFIALHPTVPTSAPWPTTRRWLWPSRSPASGPQPAAGAWKPTPAASESGCCWRPCWAGWLCSPS